jgi:hypothetical protein
MVEPCQIHTVTYAKCTLPSLRSQFTSHQKQHSFLMSLDILHCVTKP